MKKDAAREARARLVEMARSLPTEGQDGSSPRRWTREDLYAERLERLLRPGERAVHVPEAGTDSSPEREP